MRPWIYRQLGEMLGAVLALDPAVPSFLACSSCDRPAHPTEYLRAGGAIYVVCCRLTRCDELRSTRPSRPGEECDRWWPDRDEQQWDASTCCAICGVGSGQHAR